MSESATVATIIVAMVAALLIVGGIMFMADRTEKCAMCGEEKPARDIRYNRNDAGEFQAQCSTCRAALKAAKDDK